MKKRKPKYSSNANNTAAVKLPGCRVVVEGEGDRAFDRAMKMFTRRVADSGIIQDLREREFYETPGQRRRRKKSMARNRWLREQKMAQNQRTLIDQ